MTSDPIYYTRAPDLEVHESDDGLIVHNPATDRVHHLNFSSGALFELCRGRESASALAEKMAALYSLDEHPTGETETGLRQLVDEGILLEIRDTE